MSLLPGESIFKLTWDYVRLRDFPGCIMSWFLKTLKDPTLKLLYFITTDI